MIYTGQTGWMQGARYGFVLDATPNDYVSGELEHAIVTCDREAAPDVMVLEGQSSLRNPSGPCGSEFLLSAAAKGVVLQHAAGRDYFEGYEEMGLLLPSLADEIALIKAYGAQTLAVTLSSALMQGDELERYRAACEAELGIPVVAVLEQGLDASSRWYVSTLLSKPRARRQPSAAHDERHRISAVTARNVPLELARPYTIAFRTVSDVELGIVEIHTEAGLVGPRLRVARAIRHRRDARGLRGRARAGCRRVVDWPRHSRADRAVPHARQRHARHARGTRCPGLARCTICWRQHLGVPVADMLGRCHHALPTSITIGIKPLDETLAEADEHVGNGFRVLKVKLGHSLEDDLERLAKVRERIGARC